MMNKLVIDGNKKIDFVCNCEYDIEINSSDNCDITFNVKDGVKVKIYIHSVNSDIKGSINYYLGKDSCLDISKFSFSGNVNILENIYLDGEGSIVNYNFSGVVFKKNYYKVKVFHNNSNVSSYISNRCIGNDGSEIVFDIDSILKKGNVGCVMDQTSKIMCLGDVDARICPNMFVDEEDVVARHGSVIGRFSDDDIFYVMSRGIGYKEALFLLIKGFILGNLNLDTERIKEIVDILDNCYI